MKIRTTIILFFLTLGIFPQIGVAIPGLNVITYPADPITIQAGVEQIVNYDVIITNEDDGIEGRGQVDKKILYLDNMVNSGWDKGIFRSTLENEILSPSTDQSRTTGFSVNIPSTSISGNYEYVIWAYTEFEICDGGNCFNLPEEAYTFIHITLTQSAPIPEFPTVALPIISALGLLFLMRRGK